MSQRRRLETDQPAAWELAHLTPDLWSRANRLLATKALSEFSHERMLEPLAIGGDQRRANEPEWRDFQLLGEREGVSYRFRARVLPLRHWHIDSASIVYTREGVESELDAIELILDFKGALGVGETFLPGYLEEMACTLYSLAYKLAHGREASEVATSGFQEIEAAMIEGHPCFVANSARLGYDAADFRAYAPEAAARVHLVWLAAHRRQTSYSFFSSLDYESFLQQELGAEEIERFRNVLAERGLSPDDYLFVPTHPWQWRHRLVGAFAPDIARQELVYLGSGRDAYRPQQSIRTMFNLDRPGRCYVKTAISILNMGFVRGLSPNYMAATPAINEWLANLLEGDAYLREVGFGMIGEVAAVGYRSRYYHTEAVEGDTPYKKMLATLWRESPLPLLRDGQRMMTMAALLHRDPQGKALLPELVRLSGLDAESWLRRYLDCYWSPLLHCFYAHDLVFLPHGENTILVLEAHIPVRAIMKDLAEEITVFGGGVGLPEEVKRIALPIPDELRVLSIFTDILDCYFRFLANLLDAEGVLPVSSFWGLVAEYLHSYQARFPQWEEKYRRFDLFADTFLLSCLNRLQLRNSQRMIDIANPAAGLMFAGSLDNPLAPYRTHGLNG